MAVRHLALIALAACGSPDEIPEPAASVASADAVAGEAVRGRVGEPLVLDGSASVGDVLTWSTSDGRVTTGARVELVFDAPGHYTAVLEATDTLGRVDTDSVSISVAWPAADPAPASASALVADGDRLVAVLPDFDLVVEVDRAARTVLRWSPTCDEPRSVAVGHGALWVACAGDDTVARIDDAGDLRTVLPWGSRPVGILTRADDVLVTLAGAGAIARIDAAGGLQEIVGVGPDVRGLAAIGSTVLASRYRSPDDAGRVHRLDAGLELVGETRLAPDPGPDSDTNARGVPNLLAAVVIRPDGRVAAVPGSKANVQRGLFRDGLPLTFETTCRADLRQIALDPGEGPIGSEREEAVFDDRDQAVAAAYSPEGDWLFVLHRGMEAVDVLDGWSLQRAGTVPDVGSGGEGLWVSPDGAELWVLASASRKLSVFDVRSVQVPIPAGTVDLLPPAGEILDPEVLQGQILFGRSVDPRMTTGGYLSCASCHPDGDHDGRTWDFTDRGEGLRNTISLRGRAGRAPIHWSANFDELQDFENDIRGPQSGLGFLDDADFAATSDPLGASKEGLSEELDALAAYVRSLHEVPRSPFPEGSAEGEALFVAAGCPECHPAPLYEDSAFVAPGEPLLHDVGTIGPGSGSRRGEPLTGLDTPTLRGLATTAPYLHDGSAATVREVLVERNPTDLHGVTSELSEAEIGELEAFLLSL